MGFQNPVSGAQGALERQQIKSPNYAAGSAGWAIKRDGSAEFNNITIRGASTVGGTAIWYNGTPAFGNVLFSVAAAAFTDTYGNHIPQGVTSFTQSFTSDVGLVNGNVVFGHASSDFNAGATIFQGLTAGGDLSLDTGSGDANHNSPVAADLRAGLSGSPTGSSNTPHVSLGSSATSPAATAVDLRLTGSVIAYVVGGGGTAETWQTPSYAANWAAGTTSIGGTGLHYRRMAEDDLWLCGIATSSAGASNTVFTLPAAYQVAPGALFASPHGAVNLIRGTTVSAVEMAIDTSGNVLVGGNPQAGDLYSFNLRVPLGHVA